MEDWDSTFRRTPMVVQTRAVTVIAVFLSLAMALAAGCASNDPEAFTPADDVARTSVEAALEAWLAGKPPSDVGASSNDGLRVQVVDSDWTAGKRLTAYEIISEGPQDATASRQFSVKLTFDGAAQPVEAIYHVVGKDPVWVFRDKDYAQTRGM